jgi:hypothetical protein
VTEGDALNGLCDERAKGPFIPITIEELTMPKKCKPKGGKKKGGGY